MRFIEGRELSELIHDCHFGSCRKLKPHARWREIRKLIVHFVAVCKTVEYAHSKGVVHCDIKPQNIRVGEFGETFLMDWGESICKTSKVIGTRTPSGNKTPKYTAPEIDISGFAIPNYTSDVYSLGCVLFEILTGSPNGKPNGNSRTAVPELLLAIAEKATSAQTSERYQKVTELTDDVEAWLNNERVSVGKERFHNWLVRVLSRHSVVSKIAIASLALVFCLLLALLWNQRTHSLRSVDAQRGNLIFATGVAADGISDSIQARWQLLEFFADKEELNKLLVAGPTNAETSFDAQSSKIDSLLSQYAKEELKGINFATFFVLDRNGKQLAKFASSGNDESDSVGSNRSHRSYFHGGVSDYPESRSDEAEPISSPSISGCYTSETTSHTRIAFSVPVFANGKSSSPVIGVVCLSLEIDDLAFVNRRLKSEQVFAIVDIRERKGDDEHHAGFVAFHRGYIEQVERGEDPVLAHVPKRFVDQMREVETKRIRQHKSVRRHERILEIDNFVTGFEDPVYGTDGWQVAFEPVVLCGADGPRNTGLFVLIEEN